MTGRSEDYADSSTAKDKVLELQPLGYPPPSLADTQNFITLKKLAYAIIVLQSIIFFLLLAIVVVAAQTQSTAVDMQNRIASRLPVIEGIIDGFATMSKFLHSSMPDVTRRMLTSDKRAALRDVNVLADRVFSVFNSQTTLSGAETIAEIASLVRSVTAVFGVIPDVCPAAGQPLCQTRRDDTLDSDIMAIPSYIVSHVQKQANVPEIRLAAQACSRFFNNLVAANLAGTYTFGQPLRSSSWDFSSAKPTFSDIARWCTVIGTM